MDEQDERKQRRDERLLFPIEKPHRADIDKGKVERRHAVHRCAALQIDDARRHECARQIFRVGDHPQANPFHPGAARECAYIVHIDIPRRLHRFPCLLQT